MSTSAAHAQGQISGMREILSMTMGQFRPQLAMPFSGYYQGMCHSMMTHAAASMRGWY